jgi:hypothetical protein
VYPVPKILASVLALVGDSTITRVFPPSALAPFLRAALLLAALEVFFLDADEDLEAVFFVPAPGFFSSLVLSALAI